MTILVLGAHGMLGSDVIHVLKEQQHSFFAPTRTEADITKKDEIEALMRRVKPTAVINCTAMHDVARCEKEPSIAMEVNCVAIFYLAKLCAQHQAKLVTMSTDYVFDGKKEGGYTEEDVPNPLMWYGRSKLAGEWAAQAGNSKTFVVRTQSLYGRKKPSGKGLHFVDLIQKLAQEKDEIHVDQFVMAPTWTYPLARGIVKLLMTENYGLYHMSCHGSVSWHDFACEIARLKQLKTKITPVEAHFFPRNFARPQNSYLVNNKLQKIGIDLMPTWREAIQEYLS